MNLNQAMLILTVTIVWFTVVFVLMCGANEYSSRYLIGHIMLAVGLIAVFIGAWFGIAALYVMLGS